MAMGLAAATEAYRVGPGDVLTVSVLRHPELSVDQVTVNPDGSLQAPAVGSLAVSGKTIEETRELIAAILRDRLVNPEVNVALRTPRIERVFVLGAVAKPGIYDMKPGWRITEALAAGGGLTARPESTGATLFRGNGESIVLDLSALLADGNAAANVPLQPADVLTLNERTLRVSVAGQVQRPGLYDIPTGAGAVEAVAMAGGATPGAALSKVKIQRAGGAVVTADLFRAMVFGEVERNLKLETGDLVIVPQSQARIAVLGAVNRPGYYDIEEGLSPRITDVLALAGGPIKRARIGEVAIVRTEDGKPVRLMVDVNQVLRQGKTEADLAVRSGDVVYVPEGRVDWDLTLRAIGSLGVLGGLLF
jgi:protein involved in polysaccharide export with SLBB domain